MERQIHAELLRLASDSERTRQEHRDKKRALLEEFRSKEDALQESFDDQQAVIEKRKAHLFLQLASSSQRLSSSGIVQLELEPVTSSSPDDTMHPHATDHIPQQQQQPHFHQQSDMLALPEKPRDAQSSGHSSHHHSASDPEQLQGHNDHQLHETSAGQQPLGNADMDFIAPAFSPVTETAHARDAEQTPADLHESSDNAESEVEIDVTHVVPVAEQREPGTSTFMMCRPRRRRNRVARAWPAELWKPLKLEPVIAEPVSVSQCAAQPCAPTKLQTNDEALVENKDVASLVDVRDMTPAIWSDILTPGPAFLRTSVSKGIRHTLWANHMWLKQQQSQGETNDSDEDDTEQFGIQEGVDDGGEQVVANDKDEEEVLPLYGEADSDFGDASSEVGGPPPSHGVKEDLTHEGDEASISLIDAYRGIMAGVGLSGDPLEAWLEEWMKLISADVSEMAQGGIGSTIPGSTAAELLVERRLGRAVAAIAETLGSMHQRWQTTQQPHLEHRSYKIWQQVQRSEQKTHWQMDASHWQEHLAKLVLEVAKTHLHRAKLPVKAIRRGCMSIQQILVNLDEVLFKLSIAELPQAPPKPSRKRGAADRHNQQLPQASSGQSGSLGSMTDEDGDASGSWLVDDDDHHHHMGAVEGAAEVSSKRRRTCMLKTADAAAPESIDQPDSAAATGTIEAPAVKGIGTDADVTANTAWNAARLQTGMTEILVAPGLGTPQDEAKSSPPSSSSAHQDEGEGAAGDLAGGTHSQTLELHLEADSKEGGDADGSDPHVPSEVEEDHATPVTGLQGEASSPLEEEAGMAADADEADADAQSMLSDGADSYQGLPPETLAHLAASANENTSDASEEAEQEAAAARQTGVPNTVSEQGMEEDAPPDALMLSATAQTEADGKAEQEDNNMPEEVLQLGDSIREAGDQDEVHMAVDELPDEATGSPHNSDAAEALSSSEVVKWQAGAGIEVHCSTEPQVWSWRLGTLGDSCSSEATRAMVRWESTPPAGILHAPTPCLLELIELARLRPMPPTVMHIAETDMSPRRSVVEVDCNDDGGYKCAVLVGRQRTYLGEQEDLDSMVHAISPGFKYVLYFPERQECTIQTPRMHMRRPMNYSAEQDSFEDLAEEQTSALLEAWGFARTAAAAKVLAKRRDSKVLQGLKEVQKANDTFDEKRMQMRFTRKHLARQPFMDFKKAKTLLNMGSLQRKRLLRQKNIHISAGPMKATVPAAAAAPASPGANKRKRSSNPGRRQQPDDSLEAGTSQKDQRQEQRQEQGRKQREADALAQQERIKELKQKKERRQSLAAATAAPLLTHGVQTDADAQPLFPEQKAGSQVMVASSMASKLKPHQWDGVRFLYKNIVLEHEAPPDAEDKDEEDTAGGVILAHSMGLGKSLQTIAFLHTFHAYWPGKRSLLLVPSNVLHNWVDEFQRWLPRGRDEGENELTPSKVHVYSNPVDVHVWSGQTASVLIISYDMFSRLKSQVVHATSRGTGDAPPEKALLAKKAFEILCEEAEIVVADEGHQIKNPTTKKFAAVNSLRTRRRIALTGYPLQNNLDEYYTMIRWCGDDVLGEVSYFHDTFAKPIQDGQSAGASKQQVQHMYKQLSILQDMMGFVHRIGPEQLLKDLPAKHEHVVLVCLDIAQQRMYQAYLDVTERYRRDILMDTFMLHLISHRPKEALDRLQKLAEGGGVEIEAAVEDAVAQTDGAEGDLQPAASGDSQQRGSTPDGAADAEDAADSGLIKSGRKARSKGSRKLPAEAVQQLLAVRDELEEAGTPLGAGPTAKAWATQHILHRCQKRGEKLVIFCQYLTDLDDIEAGLKQIPLRWVKGKQYLRLDGKVSSHVRQQHTARFNDPKSEVQVYLISTKAGSVGINLTAAFRMIIYDELWNPVHNAQAIARIYRYGQTHATFVYRLLYKGTAEHRVYRRNVDKEGLFMRVVDKQTVKGTNKLEDVDIYAFDPPTPADAGTLNNVAVNSTDEVLKALLRADITLSPRCIAGWENHRENLPEDPSQKLTAEQRREAARQFTYFEENMRGAFVGGKKRTRLMKKRYADDEDFQLTPAQVAQLMAQQAAELEDTDIPPPAILPPSLPSQQTTPVHSALERQPPQSVPAAAVAAALQTSASMPAVRAASMPTAAQGKAAEHEISLTPAVPALLQAASVPLTEPPHAAPTPSAAKAGRSQAADVAEPANALPGQLRRVPHSPVQRPSQELHPAASGSAVTGAGAASSVVAAATGAADAATATAAGSGSAAPSAALSGGQSQKSAGKVWLPPAALASPQRSSGGLKEVVDQAAERLQKKRKAGEMPTSPFASPTAAHQASADRQSPASKSLPAERAAWGSSLSPQQTDLGCSGSGNHPKGEVLLERLREYVQEQGGELAPGWKAEVKTRSSGNSAGTSDAYYISPAGQRFRSRQEIMRHLETAAQQGKNHSHQDIRGHLSGGSQSTTGSKQEQQRLAQARANAASDASQGQSEAALGQMPAAPLFVAQSPAGKGQADEWVKKYLAVHPKESEEVALRAWKQRRRQALSLKGTPDKARSEQPLQTSPSLDFVRSSLPQLAQRKQAPQGSHQAKRANPDALQGPDQAKEADVTAPPSKATGPRLPARAGKRSVPHVNHGQVLVSQDKQYAPNAAAPEAAGPRRQLPEEEQQHASELQRHSAVSVSQAGGSGQPSKKKKDRKEKKRKHKGSKQSSAAQESSAHQDSSSLAGASERGRSLSLEPSSAAAAGDDDDDQTGMGRKLTKRRRSESADPPEAASPSAAPARPSPSDFPELQGSAKRFAGLSPKAQKLQSASPHKSALGNTVSPTIQELFSRQTAYGSPGGAKPSSAPASAAVKPAPAHQAAASNKRLLASSRSTQRQSSVGPDSAAPESSPEKQHNSHLVMQAAGILSEALSASPAGNATYQRSIDQGERAGQPIASSANARHQSSPRDGSSAIEQTFGADEQAIDVSSPAGKGEGSAPLPGSAGMHSGQLSQGSRASQKQNRKSRKFSMADVIEILD